MWLLKLHIAISILCLLSVIGVTVVLKERILRFRTKSLKPKGIRYFNYLVFFCPGVNVLLVVVIWFMAFCDDQTVELIVSSKQDKEAK